MNARETLNIEREAAERLSDFLRDIPTVRHVDAKSGVEVQRPEVDVLVKFDIGGRQVVLVCEVKSSGQPRFVRDAINQLSRQQRSELLDAVPIVVAPYFSEQAQRLCREANVGYLDFEGNARIAFDTVYIERKSPTQPKAEHRVLRSLFKPKSARILRTLLKEPGRPWRTAELANRAGVSAGHVSSVGKSLRDRDWAALGDDGFTLTDPNGLLDAWAEDYAPPEGQRNRLYTHLHGDALEKSLRSVMANPDDGQIVLGSYSAAVWLAPYGRNPNRYIYTDHAGFGRLVAALKPSPSERGGNILVWIPDEDGVLADAIRLQPDLACTSPVQTYLDLMNSGDRGREAAEHLRRTLLQWQ